jgi:hypothetical protein
LIDQRNKRIRQLAKEHGMIKTHEWAALARIANRDPAIMKLGCEDSISAEVVRNVVSPRRRKPA